LVCAERRLRRFRRVRFVHPRTGNEGNEMGLDSDYALRRHFRKSRYVSIRADSYGISERRLKIRLAIWFFIHKFDFEKTGEK